MHACFSVLLPDSKVIERHYLVVHVYGARLIIQFDYFWGFQLC